MTVKIVAANEQASPAGKLADAELHFVEGPLGGLKLIGFSVWERRSHRGGATSRSRRAPTRSTASGAATRCCGQSPTRTHRTNCATLILSAYTEHEAQNALAR